MIEKTVVLFANSIKNHQHCVAGKDIKTKKWIRAVANESGKELTYSQVLIKNPYGVYEAKPLQRAEIKFIKHAPLPNQPENYMVSNQIWIQRYTIGRDEIKEYLDYPDNLWIDYTSEKDRVDYRLIENGEFLIYQSLYLIEVKKLHIYWYDRSNFGRSPQRRGRFRYKGIVYDLPITDPKFSEFSEKNLYNKYLCISLGEEFNGYCYKIIAAIL